MSRPVRECITVAKMFDGDMVLAKNRDRNYKPRLKIVKDRTSGSVVFTTDTNKLHIYNGTEWKEKSFD